MGVRQFFAILVAVLCSVSARAQSISAQVSSRKVQVGVPFEYAVVISGSSSNYNQPYFRDFDVVSGPNQTRSVQNINGVVHQQMIFSYHLVARSEGKFTIPSANALVGGQRLETAAITVEAVRGAVPPGGDQQEKARPTGEDLFIRTSASKTRCYLGEQITISQKVYSRWQIIGFQKLSKPTYDGFYSETDESQNRGQVAMENVGGVNYYTFELFRTTATASKAGKIQVMAAPADVVIRRQSEARPRNIFEQFFGAPAYEDIALPARSRPLTVEVLPLPEEGKPEDFNGAVGNFTSKVSIDRTEVPANEAINLRMTINGRGNLRLISPPALKLPETFESYEPKVTESGSSRTFDYLVIPRREGEYVIDNINFSYFNLDSKKYVSIPSGEIRIKVLPGDKNSPGAQVYNPQIQVKETENDIRYIKKGNFRLHKQEEEFFNSPLHLGLLAVILLGLTGALAARAAYLRHNSDQVQVRERQAGKTARKQLTNAEKLMKENRKDEFYNEILTALNRYLSHKLNIPVSDLSRSRIHETMNRRLVNGETVTKLMGTLDNSEYARYAPGAVSGDLRQVYADTISLITALEQQLNRKV